MTGSATLLWGKCEDMDEVLLAHSATKLAGAAGRVVVCGSHGGRYPGLLAAAERVRAILLNDAGVGLDAAGIAALPVCEAAGIAAATLDHRSCRIGDAYDALVRGVVSFANGPAMAYGLAPGMAAREAAERLLRTRGQTVPRMDAGAAVDRIVPEEHRVEDWRGGQRIVIVDSASLVRSPQDAGAIIVTASHGALVGGETASAGRAEARLFAFNDAGVGIDGAGITRLPALQARGIAALTVDCHTARIGEGHSTLEDGIISHLNEAARSLGATQGTPLREVVASLTGNG